MTKALFFAGFALAIATSAHAADGSVLRGGAPLTDYCGSRFQGMRYQQVGPEYEKCRAEQAAKERAIAATGSVQPAMLPSEPRGSRARRIRDH
ncbi:MAG TPA: hypothetical protein VF744_15605 [Beijerinckiaceae bacterium]|jgi:hypothetical protein